ncbi:transmembrane protein 238-like isoform X2 [Neovison vison]|uniref:transmembrane protein 238-like isoform X2 n=1 Tax=Neovison vison TaxID=452646 RepID=UPI001CF08E31|nr:transmembrane protein 238-like isoform X2 [Neogale vison]
MELSRNSVEPRKPTGLGRCRHFFWLGVVFDTVGATLLFTGVFAHLLFYDLLLYLGSIIIFFSLLWWVFWYTGNIELTAEESLKEPFHVPSSPAVNALNQRLSHTLCNVSRSLTRIRRRCALRTFLLRSASLSMTGTARPENQLEQEDQGKDATAGAQESGDAQNLGSEDLVPKPEAVNHRSFHRFRFQLCESTNTYLNLVLETSVWGPDLSQTSRPPTLLLPRINIRNS